MADFSKQYIERYNPDMGWDFDIEKEFEEMPLSSFRTVICEGFGFFGLEKDKDGKQFCVFGDKWNKVPYEEITDETYLSFRDE